MFAGQLLIITEDGVTHVAAGQCALDVGLDAHDTAMLRDYAAARMAAIRDLATAMSEPDDEIELYRTLAAFWLELRFEWQRNNEIMNYQTVLRGAAEPRVVAEGAVGSFVLARIETLLDPSHLELLTRYALELLENERASALLTDGVS
jgi:hypothetical protein